MRQAVILAGGKGTRLQDRLDGMPKPLIDVGGIPLLERQIMLLQRYGFDHLLLLVNHAAEHIVDFCAQHDNWGMNLRCIDDGSPRGTAGATLAVLDHLDDEFLVMYGDTMLDVDLDRFHTFHAVDNEAGATLFLHPNDHPHDSDLVDLDNDGAILAFHPYPHEPAHYYRNLVNAALYWVRKFALEPWQSEPGILDFGKQIFPAMLDSGMCLRGYVSPEYIKDAGTPERLDRVCVDLESGKIERATLSNPQSVIFLDRDGTINQEVNHLNDPSQFKLLPGIGTAIRRINESDYRSCVITNQPVIARGECSFDKLRVIHNKLDTLLGDEGAYLDQLYFCPHHPDKGFEGERPELKIDCDCRKPRTGMIDQADKALNVSRETSWLIGDTTVDIETARVAGIKSILVETGYAGLDQPSWIEPDFCFPDLLQSVTFVLDVYPRLLEYADNMTATFTPGSIVLLGGLSRSGKSHLSSALRLALAARGQKVVVISLDRWLYSVVDRTKGVLGRYDLDSVQTLLERLSKRKETMHIQLPGYNKIKQEQVKNVASLSMEPDDVLIIEGTVALALTLPDRKDLKRYHLAISEKVRLQRLLREYNLRGFTEQEAIDLYQQRQIDEVPVIESLADGASLLPPVPDLT